MLKIIRTRLLALREKLSRGNAGQVLVIADHVRLIIIPAAVRQRGKAICRIALMHVQTVLKPNHPKKLLRRQTHPLLKHPVELSAA